MRTTLTLDDDLMRELKDEAHRQRKPFRDVVNDAIRKGLSGGANRARKRPHLKTYSSVLRPGFDATGFNKLADELEDEALAVKLAKRR